MPSFDGEMVPVEDLEDLYETAPCGYVSVLPDGRVAKANATLTEWTGYARGGLTGLKLHDLLTVGQRIFYETHLAPLLRIQGWVYEVSLELKTLNGGQLPVLANAAEKRDGAGNLLFTRLTFLKAVAHRQYERGLVEARTVAEETTRKQLADSELREQFIAVLGHDLRNPLAAIAGGVRLLTSHEQLSARGQQVVALMEGSVNRAAELIDNVLDFARGRLGGGIALSRNMEAPLTPVLKQVVAELQANAGNRDIEAKFAIGEPVNCDRMRVAQLVSNLLGNALTHGAADVPIKIRAATTDKELFITIANGGVPIPAPTMERLFQPFFRGDVRASRQGLGLGLYIASEIAKAHNGTLTVSSTNVQTEFRFRMPLTLSS